MKIVSRHVLVLMSDTRQDVEHYTTQIVRQIEKLLSDLASIIELKAQEYWKITEWTEFTVIMESTIELGTVFDSIVHALGQPTVKGGDATDKWAVWDMRTGLDFAVERVEWASLNSFKKSSIVFSDIE